MQFTIKQIEQEIEKRKDLENAIKIRNSLIADYERIEIEINLRKQRLGEIAKLLNPTDIIRLAASTYSNGTPYPHKQTRSHAKNTPSPARPSPRSTSDQFFPLQFTEKEKQENSLVLYYIKEFVDGVLAGLRQINGLLYSRYVIPLPVIELPHVPRKKTPNQYPQGLSWYSFGREF